MTRKSHFPNWKPKNTFFRKKFRFFSQKNLIMHTAEKGTFSSKNYLLSTGICYESERATFDQMKNSKKTHRAKKMLQQIMIKY